MGTLTGVFCRSVATVTCGQERPRKLSSTFCEYWSWWKSGWPGTPFTVSIQKVETTCAASAFGPCWVPWRKAVLLVPPPGTGVAVVVTSSTVVWRMVWPMIAAASTELGLLTIPWVMPLIPGGGERKGVATARFCSGKTECAPGLPIGKGSMLIGGKLGGPAI